MKPRWDESEHLSLESPVKGASNKRMMEFQESVTIQSCVPVIENQILRVQYMLNGMSFEREVFSVG